MSAQVPIQECLTSHKYTIYWVLLETLHLPTMTWLLQGKTKEQLAWSVVKQSTMLLTLISTSHVTLIWSVVLRMIQTLASGPSHFLVSFNPHQRQSISNSIHLTKGGQSLSEKLVFCLRVHLVSTKMRIPIHIVMSHGGFSRTGWMCFVFSLFPYDWSPLVWLIVNSSLFFK